MRFQMAPAMLRIAIKSLAGKSLADNPLADNPLTGGGNGASLKISPGYCLPDLSSLPFIFLFVTDYFHH